MARTIRCTVCGVETPKRAASQKYCPPCSTQRDLERKRLWAREHPPAPEQAARNTKHGHNRTELSREAGLVVNRKSARSIVWCHEPPDLLWIVRIAVPFSYATSKNHLYTTRRTGHVALRREARAKRTEITVALRQALARRRVAHNKLWIDLLVQKPSHKGDAINVVDLVCDAVKDAVPVDDNWFSIRRLDWEIVKEQPRLYIGVGQDADWDGQVCSYCGQIRELACFNKHKGNHLGVGRECKDCRRKGRLLKKGIDTVCCAGCGRDTTCPTGYIGDAFCDRCISHGSTHAFPEELDRAPLGEPEWFGGHARHDLECGHDDPEDE
ncbi:MAG: hypothetical protein ACE5KM_12455 [Planctomycetaceae bacterium]